MLRESLMLTFSIVLAIPVGSFGTETIDGRTYELQGDVWSFVDSNAEQWEIALDLIEIKFHSGVTGTQRSDFATTFGFTLDAPESSGGYYRYHYGLEADPIDVLGEVVASWLVEDAELAYKIKPLGDPYFTFEKQWNAYLINLDRALDVSAGNEILIAIHDFGVDREHEDLLPTVWSNPLEIAGDEGVDDDHDDVWNRGRELVDDIWGWNFDTPASVPQPHDPTPVTFHGTAVAGMAVAANDNDSGIASPGGGNASSRPIRWLAVVGTNNFTMSDAFAYCLNKGVDIINMSFTFSEDDNRAKNAMIAFSQAGGLLVAASGNTCEGTVGDVHFPASHDSVLAVGAVDSLLSQWDYSCGGAELDLVAPAGFDVVGDPSDTFHWSTDNYCADCDDLNPGPCDCESRVPDAKYTLGGGTSSAAPQVAGVAALVWSQRPDLTAAQVKAVLRRSARDLGATGRDNLYGDGLVDAYRAVTRWGVIAQNTTWSGVIYVSGDITVSAGATLTIAPGTVVHVAADDNEHAGADDDRIELNIEGGLVAIGTSTSPIVFDSWTPETTADWVGFYFDGESDGGTFKYCEISRAEYAIESYVNLAVRNTVFEDCGYTGVLSQTGTVLVRDCTFTAPGTWGIFLTAADGTIRNTVVSGATGAGLQVQSNASAIVRNSQFLSNGTGLAINAVAEVDIDTMCVFNSNAVGIYCYGTPSTLVIKNNTINSNTGNGIRCESGSDPLIQNNVLRYNALAIYCTNSSDPTVKSNMIKSNTYGISAATDSDPDFGVYPTSGNNTIAYSYYKHVVNWNEFEISAENNCWNVNTGECYPPSNKIYGSVDTDYPICCSTSSAAGEIVPEPELEQAPPKVTDLIAIVPNPFNPSTTIHYALARQSSVRLTVYDVSGRVVRELVNRTELAGSHSVTWEGSDARGSAAASGVYFVKMSAGTVTRTMKMVLLK